MARIIEIDAYDVLTGKTEKKHINPEQVVEVKPLNTTGAKPLTRVEMTNNSSFDVQLNAKQIADLLE